MIFSEDSRVKILCILHLVRLGYQCLSLKGASWYEETNISPDLFHSATRLAASELYTCKTRGGSVDVTVRVLCNRKSKGEAHA